MRDVWLAQWEIERSLRLNPDKKMTVDVSVPSYTGNTDGYTTTRLAHALVKSGSKNLPKDNTLAEDIPEITFPLRPKSAQELNRNRRPVGFRSSTTFTQKSIRKQRSRPITATKQRGKPDTGIRAEAGRVSPEIESSRETSCRRQPQSSTVTRPASANSFFHPLSKTDQPSSNKESEPSSRARADDPSWQVMADSAATTLREMAITKRQSKPQVSQGWGDSAVTSSEGGAPIQELKEALETSPQQGLGLASPPSTSPQSDGTLFKSLSRVAPASGGSFATPKKGASVSLYVSPPSSAGGSRDGSPEPRLFPTAPRETPVKTTTREVRRREAQEEPVNLFTSPNSGTADVASPWIGESPNTAAVAGWSPAPRQTRGASPSATRSFTMGRVRHEIVGVPTRKTEKPSGAPLPPSLICWRTLAHWIRVHARKHNLIQARQGVSTQAAQAANSSSQGRSGRDATQAAMMLLSAASLVFGFENTATFHRLILDSTADFTYKLKNFNPASMKASIAKDFQLFVQSKEFRCDVVSSKIPPGCHRIYKWIRDFDRAITQAMEFKRLRALRSKQAKLGLI